jgi:POT family proton-dependent oligopeptide transporter
LREGEAGGEGVNRAAVRPSQAGIATIRTGPGSSRRKLPIEMFTEDRDAASAPARDGKWFGHPRGLSILFFTETWERFSYYGMRAILILYMVAPPAQGGPGFSTEKAASIYGWYTMLVYAAAIPGGLIADRFLGHSRAVLVGGILIACGHFCMAIHGLPFFFAGLALICAGTGLLKPNVSTMVGELYAPADPRRDSGFSIFYMGINIGAMLSPLVCGYLGQRVDWHAGFAAAGIGMTLGLVTFAAGKRWLPEARPGVHPGQPGEPSSRRFTAEERRRLSVIGILFFFAVLFWGAFEQAGSSLTLFADRYTRLSLMGFSFPSSWFQVEQPLFVLVLAPVFAWMWLRMGKRQPSSPAKFAAGLLLVGLGFLILVPAAAAAQSRGIRVSPLWLTALYLVHTFGELCLSPVGLSLVTKLAPARIVGLMMGVWFLATSFGNKLAGWIAGFFDVVPVARLFLLVALTGIGASFLLALLIRPIRRLTEERHPGAGVAREPLEAGGVS